MLNKRIWITWENQRRSVELSKALGLKCYILTYNGNYLIRNLVLALKTILLLARVRPEKIFIQNPSMVATTIVCFLKGILNYKVIVDRHTNFKFSTIESKDLKYKAFHFLSKYTIKRSDLTIVTNNHLKQIVDECGGKGFVLQDKIPELPLKERNQLKGWRNLVFISSFAEDEPVQEVIEAARTLDKNICLYITGNYRKAGEQLIRNTPSNVILTGYLPENDFQSLIYSADILITLTTLDFTLLCSAYEGVSLHKPLIISDKDALKEYFYKGVVITRNERHEIAISILTAISEYDNLKAQIVELSKELKKDWDVRFNNLNTIIEKI